jgi:inner membrane protein
MALRMFESRPLVAKVSVIGAIVVGLMIPLSMLRGLILERSQMRSQAVESVASGWGGSLTAGGPLLRVPFEIEKKSANGEVTIEPHQLFVFANDLNVQATLQRAATRHVGIYEVPVYLVNLHLSGNFKVADVLAAAMTGRYPSAIYHWNDARVRLPLSDVRSIREFNLATLAEHRLIFGPALVNGYPGVEARFDLSEVPKDATLPFSMQILLAGSQSMALLPTAATTQLKLRADWPDPQFQGAFLPSRYTLDQRGFDAEWQVLALNRAFAQSWFDTEVDAGKLTDAAFGVGLFQSVDVYQRSERAVKYALLFIALTFLSFFAWESLGNLRIHAMQYVFIGLALSTFYLLLIALTEHLPFWLSFWLGAAALVALLGFYISGVMDSARLGIVIGLVMSLVYGLLFMLVVSESYALLIGAISLFGVLATVMLATRKLHWSSPAERQPR